MRAFLRPPPFILITCGILCYTLAWGTHMSTRTVAGHPVVKHREVEGARYRCPPHAVVASAPHPLPVKSPHCTGICTRTGSGMHPKLPQSKGREEAGLCRWQEPVVQCTELKPYRGKALSPEGSVCASHAQWLEFFKKDTGV